MNGIAGVALADWRARTRSFGFIVVVALALEFAYLFVPDARAGYVTVTIGDARGVYNAAWMGGLAALCSVIVLAFAGFYVVRGAVLRDERLGTAAIVAASPVTNFAFVAGKWCSNLGLLGIIGVVLLAGCAIMQQVRGENRAFDLASYLMPFATIVVPACAVIAAVAALFDTIGFLRGVWGSVLWFVAAMIAVVQPLSTSSAGGHAFFDPFGLVPLVAAMTAATHAAFPAAHASDVSIGASQVRHLQTFVWTGMTYDFGMLASRAAWPLGAVAIVGLASRCFDRFASNSIPRARARAFDRLGRFVPEVRGLRLIVAEARVLTSTSNAWVYVVSIALGVCSGVVPAAGLVAIVLPLAFLVPLPWYASLGTGYRYGDTDALVLSAPHAVTRSIAARIAAAGLLGCIPLAGALVRFPALALVPFASAALAMIVGRMTGTPRAYEALYLAVWYLGALNHAAGADIGADAIATPTIFAGWAAIVTLAAAAGARLQLRRR